jgi:ketosteroid isomerase-like protein
MAARKAASKKGTKKATRPAAKSKASPRKKPARKKAPARAMTPTAEAVARKIVRATQHPGKVATEDLYAENCVSWEPNQADPAIGHEGRRSKDAGWEEFQDSARAVWKPKNVFIKRNTICIEWDAEIHTRDGRVVRMEEVAVHELKGGKIVSERYYFDPGRLAPPAAEPPAPQAAAPAPPEPPEPKGPKVDPIDL